MNRYKKLLQNTGLITLGTFGSKLLPFLVMRLYTAALSDGDYNTADLVTQTAKLLIPFAALGLTEGLFRLAMEGNRSLKKKVFTAGFLIFGGGFVLLVPLLLVAYLILKGYGISFSRYIFLIGLYVLASCLHSLVTQYIRTKDHFFFFSLQGVVNTVLVAVLNIVFYATGHFGVEEYVLSVALADFATFLLVFLKERLWRDLVPPRKIEKEVYSVMIRYSAPPHSHGCFLVDHRRFGPVHGAVVCGGSQCGRLLFGGIQNSHPGHTPLFHFFSGLELFLGEGE